MLQPDDLLQVMEPGLRDGKLSFRVGLKDRQLVEEMGSPNAVALVWDSQSLPTEVREPTKEAAITAVIPQAEFSAKVSSTIRWPLYFQIHVDRDPRGLVASLDRSGDGFALANWKENRPPTVHITRVLAAAQRSNGQPEKFQVLIRPPAPWLAYPRRRWGEKRFRS